jgi:lysophospholipase L1-like esterase
MRFIKISSAMLLVIVGLSACFDKTGSLKSLKIVCLGDSITYGYKLADPTMQSYPAQLARLSRGQWNVLNSGVNGATVLNKGDIPIIAQDAYDRALKFQPDVVVLMLGTNDTKNRNWPHINEFVGDYVKLVETFRDLPSSPHVIACFVPPILGTFPNGINTKRAIEINSLLKTAVSVSKVDSLNIYAPMSQNQSFFIDGVHPNVRGAQEIAGLVLKKISGL